jgi:hypothetical protein
VITGAFIAESASVVDSKLNVTGGVLSRFVVDVDRLVELLLVVLTQAETGNADRLVNVEIRPPSSNCRKPPPVAKSGSLSSGSK